MKIHKISAIYILIGFIVLYVAIRSIHFSQFMNFSGDQGIASSEALIIWQQKKLQLIGPPASVNFNGRYIFTGSITYYFMLLFLVPAHFDPLIACSLFMLFSALMLIPLYYGVKMLINKRAALLISVLYTLFPLYIAFTRFIWNPSFQLALSPLLILSMGLYHQTQKKLYISLVGFLAGLILMIHYQFALIVIGLTVYYAFRKRSWIDFLLFIFGITIGFSPIIIFEVKHHFYILETIWLALTINNKKATTSNIPSLTNTHYFLTTSLFSFLLLAGIFRKFITSVLTSIVFIVLLVVCLIFYVPTPTRAFGMAEHWNYPSEKKAYQIIRSQHLTNYNVVNLGYDTLAQVQRYLHRKDGVTQNFDDYRNNKYLFIISETPEFMSNSAYEVNTFNPSKQLKSWKLNEWYTLYLLERTK